MLNSDSWWWRDGKYVVSSFKPRGCRHVPCAQCCILTAATKGWIPKLLKKCQWMPTQWQILSQEAVPLATLFGALGCGFRRSTVLIRFSDHLGRNGNVSSSHAEPRPISAHLLPCCGATLCLMVDLLGLCAASLVSNQQLWLIRPIYSWKVYFFLLHPSTKYVRVGCLSL